MSAVLAWHFLRADGLLRDGRPAPTDGVVLRHTGPLAPCESGLHASKSALDALGFAPGPLVCRVRCGGEIVQHGNPVDKLACSERTIVWRVDATHVLRAFARWCALRCVNHWDAPPIVRAWLETGDESLRGAARNAAYSAAKDAAYSAAYSAVEIAACSAACSAADGAAYSAAESAARSAAWSTAESAVSSAAGAAWRAERSAQAAQLEAMLLALAPEVRE